MTKLMRVNEALSTKLNEPSRKTGISELRVVEAAVEGYYRDCIFDEANNAYEALKKDPIAWKEELKERALWDATLSDGLEDG